MTEPRIVARSREEYLHNIASVGEARRRVVEFARSHGFSGQLLDDIEAAVGEALANAVEHGSRGLGQFAVETYRDAHALTIEVTDSGEGFEPAALPNHGRPPAQALRGYGTFIMRELMDEVEYSERGTRLRLVKRLPATDRRLRPAREA